MILSERAPDDTDFDNHEFVQVYEAASDLYTLIHNRYVYSPQGMEEIREMYFIIWNNIVGIC